MLTDQILEDFVCSVCRNRFNGGDHAPYVLKCGHNLCMSVCQRLGDGQYYRSKSIKCPMCNKSAEYDYDARASKFEDLAKNFSLISVMDKLQTICCTRWKDQLSSKLIEKVDSLMPKLNNIKKWPELFKKQLIQEEADEFYTKELEWDNIEKKRKDFLEKKQGQMEKISQIEDSLNHLQKLINEARNENNKDNEFTIDLEKIKDQSKKKINQKRKNPFPMTGIRNQARKHIRRETELFNRSHKNLFSMLPLQQDNKDIQKESDDNSVEIDENEDYNISESNVIE